MRENAFPLTIFLKKTLGKFFIFLYQCLQTFTFHQVE